MSKTAATLSLLLAAALMGGADSQSTQSGWDDDPWSLRNLVSRFTGLPAVASLCSVSNCQRSQPLPARPGGKFSEFGPLQTKLVHLSASATRGYGFSGALVACPVMPHTTRTNKKMTRSVPGVAW